MGARSSGSDNANPLTPALLVQLGISLSPGSTSFIPLNSPMSGSGSKGIKKGIGLGGEAAYLPFIPACDFI